MAANSPRGTNRLRRRSGAGSPMRCPSRVAVKAWPSWTASMISSDLVCRSRWVISGFPLILLTLAVRVIWCYGVSMASRRHYSARPAAAVADSAVMLSPMAT